MTYDEENAQAAMLRLWKAIEELRDAEIQIKAVWAQYLSQDQLHLLNACHTFAYADAVMTVLDNKDRRKDVVVSMSRDGSCWRLRNFILHAFRE